jgi:hypothetical protein
MSPRSAATPTRSRSPAVPTGGNRSQMGEPRKWLNYAKRCRGLRPVAAGSTLVRRRSTSGAGAPVAVLLSGGATAVAWCGNHSTTHVLHRSCRVVAGRSRSLPVSLGEKMPAPAVIPGRSRLHQWSSYRPVTPEVAGSSPVPPAKVPANRHVVLSGQTPDSGRPHRLFRTKARNTRKRRETRLRATVSSHF